MTSSLLPQTMLPQNEPFGTIDSNGNITISKNWWLLLYNLVQNAIGSGATGADAELFAGPLQLPPIGSTTFATPTASVGLTAIAGSASTAMRSDAAPALNQGITPTWTGAHTFSSTVTINGSGTGLTVEHNASISGTLTALTGGSSIKGALTVAAPAAAGTSLAVVGLTGTSSGILSITSNFGAAEGHVEASIERAGSTANNVAQGPGTQLFDSTNNVGTILQHSGGQTELWQYDTAWRQIARWLSSASAGGQIMQIPDDGGTMQSVGYRGTPFNNQSGNYTCVLADRGKAVGTVAGFTITLPSGVFSAGDVVTLIANTVSGSITIAAGSGLTLYWANGTGNTIGNRTLTGVGIATAVYLTSSEAFISGSSLS